VEWGMTNIYIFIMSFIRRRRRRGVKRERKREETHT
jgi:hypothetical protein